MAASDYRSSSMHSGNFNRHWASEGEDYSLSPTLRAQPSLWMRHGNGRSGNFVYADGHVQSLNYGQFYGSETGWPLDYGNSQFWGTGIYKGN